MAYRRRIAIVAVWAVLVGLTAAGAALLTSWQVGPLTVEEGLQVTLPVAVLAIVIIAIGVGVTAALPRPAAATPAPAPQPPASPIHTGPAAAQQRDALVRLCIDLRDSVGNPALLERVTRALFEVGVVALSPEGMLFDPGQHRAVDRVPSADPALHNRIASTERPGYVDRGTLLRPAEVTVYQVAPPS